MNPKNPFNQFYQNLILDKREIDLILCHVLNINSAGLYIYNKEVTSNQKIQILDFCKQRINGVPFAYITGQKAFWTLDLKVNKHTLIPRPETELLVELILETTKEDFNGSILDLGTGTGAIALSIASERPQAKISAIDFSSECIKVAEYNKTKHGINNVDFYQSHWFKSVMENKFDIIVSNPPYIDEQDQHLQALKFEPISALTAKNNGLHDLFHIINRATKYLKTNGSLMLEHGYDQHQLVQKRLTELSYKNVKTHNDLAGIPRITTAKF